MDRVDQEKDVLVCVNLKDGKEKWKFEHSVAGRISHPGARTVPTVDGDFVYGSGGFGHVYCVDRKSGKKIWVIDMAKDFEARQPRFGYSIHPVIHGDLCIIAPTGDKVGLVAVNKKTSKVVWKAGSIGQSHSSPVLVKLLGKEVVVMPGVADGSLTVAGFDPKSGKQLFRYMEEIGFGIFNPIPNVTVMNTDTAVLTSGYGKGTRVLKFVEKEGKISVTKGGSMTAGATIHPPLKVGDRLFITAGSNRGGGRFGRGGRRGGFRPGGGGEGSRPGGRPGGRPDGERPEGQRPEGRPEGGPRPQGQRPEGRPEGGPRPPGGGGSSSTQSGLISLDAAGKVQWATGSEPSFGGGSIINAGGIIVSQDGGDGTLRLIKPGAKYEELASGKVFGENPGRELWAPMALSNGKLLMRSQTEMVCVDLSPAEKKK